MAVQAVDFFRDLAVHRVRYLVCGGLAVKLHGINRRTADLDLIIDLKPANTARFEEVIKKHAYEPFLPIALQSFTDLEYREKMIKERNMVAYSYYNTGQLFLNLDVMVSIPFSFDEAWEEKTEHPMNDFVMQILSVRHLIEMKKIAKRDLDDLDIESLNNLLK